VAGPCQARREHRIVARHNGDRGRCKQPARPSDRLAVVAAATGPVATSGSRQVGSSCAWTLRKDGPSTMRESSVGASARTQTGTSAKAWLVGDVDPDPAAVELAHRHEATPATTHDPELWGDVPIGVVAAHAEARRRLIRRQQRETRQGRSRGGLSRRSTRILDATETYFEPGASSASRPTRFAAADAAWRRDRPAIRGLAGRGVARSKTSVALMEVSGRDWPPDCNETAGWSPDPAR
jgi:hypothetical protein